MLRLIPASTPHEQLCGVTAVFVLSTPKCISSHLQLLIPPLQSDCQLLLFHHCCFLCLPQLQCLVPQEVQLHGSLLLAVLHLTELLLKLLYSACIDMWDVAQPQLVGAMQLLCRPLSDPA